MKIVNKESKIRCPNHNPTRFAMPFNNCMACINDLCSRDAQSEKKAEYTTYGMLISEVSEQQWKKVPI